MEPIEYKEDQKYFITDQFSLTAFLELSGLKYVKAELSKTKTGKVKVIFYFLDPQNIGPEIQMEFRHSDCKKYRDLLFLYKGIINDLLGKS